MASGCSFTVLNEMVTILFSSACVIIEYSSIFTYSNYRLVLFVSVTVTDEICFTINGYFCLKSEGNSTRECGNVSSW